MFEDDEPEIIESPLSQKVTRDGKTVSVEIYRGEGEEGWILEVVDGEGATTLFEDRFQSDQTALAAAIELIDREGIDVFLDDHSGTIN